jgi:glucose/arabinose dehydrogenase
VRRCLWAAALALACLSAVSVGASTAAAGTLPSGFVDSVEVEGLDSPTAVRFTPNGEIFVAQKNGEILLFEDFADEEPTVFADLRKAVYDNGDRGLLGLVLDPSYPAKPYVYALYTFDHVIGEDAPGAYPRWGKASSQYEGDDCVKPGADVDACPVSGRLVRLTAEGGHAAPSATAPAEKVLLEDWCQQFSSHSIGGLQFGPEGALFVSGGEGASFTSPDYGQFGWPHKNQCGDPPGAVGEALQVPDAEGGSLRSQDLLTPFDPLSPSDPTGLSGSLVRIDPSTGAGWPGNPLASSPDANERRLIAFGFRNPFRFAINPQTEEVYVGNVGNGTYEEIDRFPLAPSTPYNSGWPCYEGPSRNPDFNNLDLNLCEGLYAKPGAASEPFFYYSHASGVTPDDPCPSYNGSAITGSTFYEGGAFPEEYEGAFFFADSVRGCIYVILADEDGKLNPLSTRPFLANGGPYTGADVQVGPDGDLYYLSLYGDEALHRISYDPDSPIARLTADKEWGPKPLKVKFDAGGSTDPNGEALNFEWDLDENGTFETKGGSTQTTEFKVVENAKVFVRVTDSTGRSSTAQLTVYVGDAPPQISISEPLESATWEIGQPIDFAGSAKANGGSGGQLPAARLYWRTSLLHCPGGVGSCHAHPLRVFPALASGQLTAPDHDYPSELLFSLTATDDRGLSATKTVKILPRTALLQIASKPPGVEVTAATLTGPTPFGLTAIKGANVTLAAPPTAQIGGETYSFEKWSDGGSRVHSLVASSSATYTATYSEPEPEPPASPGPPRSPVPSSGAASQPPLGPLASSESPILSLHPPKRAASSAARFEFASSEPGVGYACKLDDGPLVPCRSPRIYRKLKPGEHVFRVVAEAPGDSVEYSPAAVFRWRVLAKRG